MKKIVSVLIAFAVILSAISISTITSFAREWEDIRNVQGSAGYVNGEVGGSIFTEYDSATEGLKITYGGDGTLTGWEFPLLAEGLDYDILSEDIENNVITIKLLDEGRGEIPYINALVDFDDETVSEESAAESRSQNGEIAAQNTPDDQDGFVKDESMEFTADLKSDDSTEKAESNGAKTVVIAVASGAAVCMAVLLVLKVKKSHSK